MFWLKKSLCRVTVDEMISGALAAIICADARRWVCRVQHRESDCASCANGSRFNALHVNEGINLIFVRNRRNVTDDDPIPDRCAGDAALMSQESLNRTDPVAAARPVTHDSFAALTPRERDVLNQIVAGASNKEAGRQLGISPRTIEIHRARIMDKLGTRNVAELVCMAMRLGIQH